MKINLLAFMLLSAAYTSVSAQTKFTAIGNAPKSDKKLDFSSPLNVKVTDQATIRRYATNSNRPGIIQIGLGWGTVIGGAILTQESIDADIDDTTATSLDQIGVGITNNFGFRMQIAVSEPISLGFYVRKDIGSYVAEFEDFDLNGLSVGFEGKFHFINNDYFNVYVAPTVGYSYARSNIDTFPGRGVGLNFGITAGLNWYWSDYVGMSCDIGYRSARLIGIFDDPELADLDYRIRYGGLYFGVGLIMKFDTITY